MAEDSRPPTRGRRANEAADFPSALFTLHSGIQISRRDTWRLWNVSPPSLGHLHAAGFSDNRDLDLAGILQFAFDLQSNGAREREGLLVVYLFRLNEHTQLPASLDGECFLDARQGAGNAFQIFNAFQISRHALGPCAGTRGADGVRRADQNSPRPDRRDIIVVRGYSVDDDFGFPESLDQISADKGMRSFHFMSERLANVMEQPGAFGDPDVEPQLRGHKAHEVCDFDRMIEQVLRIAVAEMQAAKDFYNVM